MTKRTRQEKIKAAKTIRVTMRNYHAAAIKRAAKTTGYSERFCYRVANNECLRT